MLTVRVLHTTATRRRQQVTMPNGRQAPFVTVTADVQVSFAETGGSHRVARFLAEQQVAGRLQATGQGMILGSQIV